MIPHLIRLATQKEANSPTAKRTALLSFPAKSGLTPVYKPYGNDGSRSGRGFYYIQTGTLGPWDQQVSR